MTADRVDEAVDRLLVGRPAPGEAAPLVAFAEAVRSAATAPGRPSPRLATLLSAGLPAAATAGTAADTAPGRTRSRRTRRMRARLGVLATGAGVALGAVAAAGAAGALPDPIQAPVSGVLEAVTPQQPSDPAEDTPTPVELPVTEEAAADPADLGGQVSEQARESPAGRGTDRGNG